ncbi:microtubule-associated protein 1B-like isoform X2 [Limulus polyphemus]|uniref:Microtubule-associated protein 1B-like isoform X2 n=1 Tax=Limulus polyphemus TaxID=6850 RepID=A0ABM1TI52_LIMPO|nr:microtubule-associated protein 1B-like isoform X2 [Limulus polyphemus]
MQFEEVVNPHFALPIVGVIVCALLVFAFGFKSPVQPPSFDQIIQEERRTAKKKKSSQKQKSQSNGQPGAVNVRVSPQVSKQSPEKTLQSKQKFVVEKTETKVKKGQQNKVTKQEEPESLNTDESISHDDGGEWVQLLSKKEKKNRRKEEILNGSVLETNREIASEDTDSKDSTPAKKKKEKLKTKNEGKETKIPTADFPKEETLLVSEPEQSPKDKRIPKKEKNEKVSLKTDETPAPQKTELECQVEIKSASDAVEVQEGKNKKKKGKKKHEEIENGTVVDDVEVDNENDSKNTLKNEEDIKQTDQQASETTGNQTFTAVFDDKLNEEVGSGDKEKQSNNNDSQSNVAFDELGDMWQDAKPQKFKIKIYLKLILKSE